MYLPPFPVKRKRSLILKIRGFDYRPDSEIFINKLYPLTLCTKEEKTVEENTTSKERKSTLKELVMQEMFLWEKQKERYSELKEEIKNVLETPQNTFFARQNRLMKGALIQTSLGKAKITNRPGQEGHINAILVE